MAIQDEVADPESDFDEQLEDEVSDGSSQTGHAEEASPDYPSGPSTDTEPDSELPETDEERRRKFYVKGVAVNVLSKRVQYYDADGKLVTESFQDYTRRTLMKEYASLNDFVQH